MANLTPTPEENADVWQWDGVTPLAGGAPTAPLNRQAQGLLNRLAWLKEQVLAIPTAISDAISAALTNRMQYTLTASQPTAGAVAYDFGSIPSWAKRITIMFNDVSTNGVSQCLVQLGTSGGISNSGYFGGNMYYLGGAAGLHETLSSGFRVFTGGADVYRFGTIVLTRRSANEWVCSGQVAHGGGFAWVSGIKILASVLTTVRLTTVNGTDLFDNGNVSLLIEG